MRRLAFLAALALAACADGGKRADFPSEWEQKNARVLAEASAAAEPEPAPPALPRAEDLLPFFVTASSDFKYFVDRQSVSVSGGRVRYTLVARSPDGVDNISYEAINCKEREFRSYARAVDGRWVVRATPWRPIQARVNLPQYTLHWEYLCPNSIAVYSSDEGVSALRAGGHPWSKLPNTAGGGGK